MFIKAIKKVFSTLLVVTVIASITSPYTVHANGLPTATTAAKAAVLVNEKGNTNSNLANGGLVVEKGDWIYYSDSINKNLSKLTKDNKVRKVIVKESVKNINVVGGWVYYTNQNNNIYKVKTDGTSKIKVSNDHALTINVVGNWIYYTIKSDYGYQNGIYKIKTDGSSKARITNNKILSYAVENSWIYYVKSDKINAVGYDEPIGRLYKVKVDGTSNAMVCDSLIDTNSSCITVEDGWIYYKSAYCPNVGAYKPYVKYADNKLYKIKVDGKSKSTLKDFKQSYPRFSNINVTNDFMYYSLVYAGEIDPSSSEGYTYKIRTDGTGEKKFTNISSEKIVNSINVANDWIFGEVLSIRSYGNWGQSFNYSMKIRTDGSNFDYYDNNACSAITRVQGNDILFKDFYGSNWKVNINSLEPFKGTNTNTTDNIKDLVNYGDWQYYLKKGDFHQWSYPLYKKKKDGTGEVRLSDNVSQFQVVGNNIIYTFQSNYENTLYKMNLDGNGKIQVSNKEVVKFAIENDTIYYDVNSQNVETAGIYKTSISNPADVKVVAGYCSDFFIKGSYIFYNKYPSWPFDNFSSTFCKVKKDGTSVKQLDNNVSVVDYTTINDSVFYISGKYLYKLNTTTNTKVKLVEASTAKITKDYILYAPNNNSKAIYKMNLNGISITKLTNNGEIDDALVVGNWVYYRGALPNQDSDDQTRYLWKVKLDGTSNQQTAKRAINNFYNFKK
jgi:hypothetical protein